MVRYKYISENDNILKYEYYPEGNKNAIGIFLVDKKTFMSEVIEKSVDDIVIDTEIDGKKIQIIEYAHHAVNDVIKSLESGNIKNQGTVMWY